MRPGLGVERTNSPKCPGIVVRSWRHKNAAVTRREGEHVGILETSQAGSRRSPEVDRGDSSDEGGDDDLIEVRVRLKADGH